MIETARAARAKTTSVRRKADTSGVNATHCAGATHTLIFALRSLNTVPVCCN